eukprot:scaffold1954_cov268-Pinguiococcus_pyrenoidosus.AAC.84
MSQASATSSFADSSASQHAQSAEGLSVMTKPEDGGFRRTPPALSPQGPWPAQVVASGPQTSSGVQALPSSSARQDRRQQGSLAPIHASLFGTGHHQPVLFGPHGHENLQANPVPARAQQQDLAPPIPSLGAAQYGSFCQTASLTVLDALTKAVELCVRMPGLSDEHLGSCIAAMLSVPDPSHGEGAAVFKKIGSEARRHSANTRRDREEKLVD